MKGQELIDIVNNSYDQQRLTKAVVEKDESSALGILCSYIPDHYDQGNFQKILDEALELLLG